MKSRDSIQLVKPWRAKAQVYIGEFTAGIMGVLGIYTMISIFSRFTQYQLPHWSSNTSFVSLLGNIVTTILSIVYVLAIRKRKLKTVQIVFRIWWVIGTISIGLVFLGIIIAGKWAQSTEGLITCILIIICISLPFGLITLLWWLGLRGLKQISKF